MAGWTVFWNTVSEPQATIIAAALTIIAATVGVVLGSWLFGGRVKDLKGALEHSDKLLQDHKAQVDATLEGISSRLGVIDEQFTAIQEALGQLRGSVNVLESTSTGEVGNQAQLDAREALRDGWAAIRDQLEQIAADPKIDGRTRAKYGRIDRRSYADLVDALASDDRLGDKAKLYHQAVVLFHKYRNGRLEPANEDVALMRTLCAELTTA